jgi:hypothetical protein
MRKGVNAMLSLIILGIVLLPVMILADLLKMNK